MPMKPSLPISAMSAGGTFFWSSICAAIGKTFSRAKSRAVFCTRACSSLSVRSKLSLRAWGPLLPVSVLVVVAMRMVLQRVYADVAAVRIAREEEVPEEVGRGRAELLGLVVRAAHVGDAEPDDECRLRADLLRSLHVTTVVHHDLGVRGLEPGRIVGRFAAQADDLLVEGGDRAADAREEHHRTDRTAMLVAHLAALASATASYA